METIIILLGLLLGGCTSSKTDGIKSHVTIIDRVDPHNLKVDSGRFFSIKIDLINDTDTSLNFWTMSCSWQDNWVFEEKSMFFFVDCPKNTPKMVQLESREKITYDGIIELADKPDFNQSRELKLGFVLVKKNEVHQDSEFRSVLYKKIDAKEDIYWSEPFKIDW